MKKSDLKTGMWVETRDGYRTVVLLNTEDGDIIGTDSSINYTEDLKWFSPEPYLWRKPEEDIVKIYQPISICLYDYFDLKHMKLIAEINQDINEEDLSKEKMICVDNRHYLKRIK